MKIIIIIIIIIIFIVFNFETSEYEYLRHKGHQPVTSLKRLNYKTISRCKILYCLSFQK